jgi:hypothetical protein
MNDPFVLFLVVAAAWFVFRIVVRRWAERKVESGELSTRDLFVLNAATWTLLPLLAIPFVTFPGGRELLLLVAGAGFVFQLVLWLLFQRFGNRR